MEKSVTLLVHVINYMYILAGAIKICACSTWKLINNIKSKHATKQKQDPYNGLILYQI